jgi:hypothetical protein
MSENQPDIDITNLRGGRNGADSPLELPDNQCVEAMNIDWFRGPLGSKRGGADELDTSTSGLAEIWSLFRHVPDGNDANAELWAVDNTGVVARNVAGVWATMTLDDVITDHFQEVSFCTLNGKLYMGYNSAVDRLHAFDPAVNAVRRVGLAAPSTAPTVANTGAGTYAAVLRYYRTRVIQLSGAIVVRKSEPSAEATFTPSGAGTAARITMAGAPGERETHWEVEVSLDDEEWFVLAGTEGLFPPIAIGTTTFDDSTVTTTYLTLTTAVEVGFFTVATSVKFLSSDGNRLLMAGAWETGGLTSRIWNSAVLGSLDQGDDERIISTDAIKGYVDINEKDGGRITALSLPIDGAVYAFKYRQTWRGTPTEDPEAPYIFKKISEAVGCVFFKTLVVAEDDRGNPILGFLSYKGPYRIGIVGLEYVGRDVEDVWFGRYTYTGLAVNLDAGTMVAHGVYHSDNHQIWWWVPQAAASSPNFKIVQDIKHATMRDAFGVRGGWSLHDNISSRAICSTMFANTIGATMSMKLKPYIGYREP